MGRLSNKLQQTGGGGRLSEKLASGQAEPEKKENILKTMARDITKPLVTSLVRPIQMAESGLKYAAGSLGFGKGNIEEPDVSVNLPFYGKIGAPEDIRKEVGTGLQTAALGLGPVSGGAAFGAGSAMEQGKSNKEIAMWGVGGALFGKLGDIAFKTVGKGIQKISRGSLEKVANKLQSSTLPLTVKEKISRVKDLDRAIQFLNKNKLYGTNIERYEKTSTFENEAEKRLQDFLETNNTAKNIYANKGSIIEKLANLKNEMMKDSSVAPAIEKQFDATISNIQNQYRFQKIPISRLNTLKRSTYDNAFNVAGDKVLDDVEFAIGDLFKTEIEGATKGLTYFGKGIAELNKEIGDSIVTRKILKLVAGRPTIQLKGLSGRILSGTIGAAIGEGAGDNRGAVAGGLLGFGLGAKYMPEILEQAIGANTKSRLAGMIMKASELSGKTGLSGAASSIGGLTGKAGQLVEKIPTALKELPRKPIKGTPNVGIQKAIQNYIKNPKLGLSLDIQPPKNILPEDAKVMEDFINGVRLKKDIPEELGTLAEKLMQRFKISPDLPQTKIANQFEDILTGATKTKGTAVKINPKNVPIDWANPPKVKQPPIYKETGPLTTKLLKYLEGKSTVSKQFISDLTNMPDLKQKDKDIAREILERYKTDQIPVKEFATKVKQELLPLKLVDAKSTGFTRERTGRVRFDKPVNYRYESITLPDELRGNVANYKEHIWESPIKTSAGETHFGYNAGGITSKNYFGHTRIEDMADQTGVTGIGKGLKPGEKLIPGKGLGTFKDSGTRRVIEVQTDLYQKGALEGELSREATLSGKIKRKAGETIEAFHKRRLELGNKLRPDISKLQQYNDPTAHFRMVREEVKQAAKDGKTKLQFPTGETAMKIEGLGDRTLFWDNSLEKQAHSPTKRLKPDTLQVSKIVNDGGQNWVITDVLGDGKFKAVPKERFGEELTQRFIKKDPTIKVGTAMEWENAQETFDISGKVDTNNPIYRFYEKDLGRYLKSKYNAQFIKDNQGVTWWELNVPKSAAKAPVEAFGVAGALMSGEVMKQLKERQNENVGAY